MAAMYFISYALIATIAVLVIAQAQYARLKNEGTPVNFKLIKAVGASAAVMWSAAGLTQVVYATGAVA